MIELTKDKKSGTWLITTTDAEGFHRQINLTEEDMDKLVMDYLCCYLDFFYIPGAVASFNPRGIIAGKAELTPEALKYYLERCKRSDYHGAAATSSNRKTRRRYTTAASGESSRC